MSGSLSFDTVVNMHAPTFLAAEEPSTSASVGLTDQLSHRYGFVPAVLQMRSEVLGALATIRECTDVNWRAAEKLASAIEALDEKCSQIALQRGCFDARVDEEVQSILEHAFQWRGVLTGHTEVLALQASRSREVAANVEARMALHEPLPAPDVGSFF